MKRFNLNFINVTLIALIISAIFSYIYVMLTHNEIIIAELLKVFGIASLVTIPTSFCIAIIYLCNIEEVDTEEYTTVPSIKGPLKKGVYYFYNNYANGFSIVEKITIDSIGGMKNEFNFVDTTGKYISEKWFDAVSNFNEFNIAIVYDNGMYNLIDTSGKILSLQWFYDIDEPNTDGISKVRWNDNEVNFITKDGKLLWDEWRPEIVLDNTKNKD